MAAGGMLLVILVLTSVNAMLAEAPNSARHVYICEDARANLYSCEDYPGIINILNVDFPEENEDYCGNNNVQKNNTCLASEDDERNLTSVLRKKCNGKRDCKIHLSHGVYKGMHLPCRDLNIRIRIGIFYDCRYSPKTPVTTDKETRSTTEPSTTASSAVSLSTLPSSRLTSTTVGASTDVSKGTSDREITVTVAPTTRTEWRRRRPNKTCNYGERDPGFLSSAPRVIFSFSCLAAQALYLFIFLP